MAVGRQDALPHAGLAAGESRRVAQAPAGPREIVGADRPIDGQHQRTGDQLRQVADRGHESIVFLALIGEHHRPGAKRLDELDGAANRIGSIGIGQEPRAAIEQVGPCLRRPRGGAAGHGMTTDELR